MHRLVLEKEMVWQGISASLDKGGGAPDDAALPVVPAGRVVHGDVHAVAAAPLFNSHRYLGHGASGGSCACNQL